MLRHVPSARRPALVAACAACVLLAAACATQRTRRANTPPGVVTVPQLVQMAQQGTSPSTMYSAVQQSGTVYRLTPEQSARMKSAGVPAGLLAELELTYEHAVRTNPSLGTSNDHWHEIDGYWYGGTPYGWPREWVVGAPPLGAPVRRRGS